MWGKKNKLKVYGSKFVQISNENIERKKNKHILPQKEIWTE